MISQLTGQRARAMRYNNRASPHVRPKAEQGQRRHCSSTWLLSKPGRWPRSAGDPSPRWVIQECMC